MSIFVVRTYTEGLAIVDKLHHACEYLAAQYSSTMTQVEMQAHVDARDILIRRAITLLDEIEIEALWGDPPKSTPDEML